jgi:acyl-homoserine-lactone acylase
VSRLSFRRFVGVRWLAPTLLLISVLSTLGCASGPTSTTATIERTTYGIPHVTAPDAETLAFGLAYAYAQDNVCMAANHLVTVRGERAVSFGGTTQGLLGLRAMPNEQIDTFVSFHMNDAALAAQWAKASSEARALARGYVAGYNRFLAEHREKLPAPCNGQAWVKPMTLAEYYRTTELSAIQAGIGAFADAVIAAKPPPTKVSEALPAPKVDAQAIRAEFKEIGIIDLPYGSNAWAFGKDVTENSRGVLLGNPHFPWVGPNRFYQMHLTIPGSIDVMGASLAFGSVVTIGFNRDIAWTHTVSTGRRFTLYELVLAENDPTSYLVDGKPEKMTSRSVTVRSRQADGTIKDVTQTLWSTRWGPVIVSPRAELNWSAKNAHALKDANSGNARMNDAWLALGRATSIDDAKKAIGNLGVPWVNTIAADRAGNAMYADVSVVPDVDTAQLARCAPSRAAATLINSLGIVVLDGAKSDCDWQRDPNSAVPGLIAASRMPTVVRSDWVQNSNDSFFHTHPDVKWSNISPLVGNDSVARARTRSGLIEIPLLIAGGKVTPERVQRQLFENRNLIARMVLPDLLAACLEAPNDATKEACAALRGWNRTNDGDARGAHLFREFWRTAVQIKDVYREPFSKAEPVTTPRGLRMSDATVASRVWDALANAAKKVKDAGFALDAPLGNVQRPAISEEAIGIHGGDDAEGILNNIGARAASELSARGLRVDYGTSYVQSVSFDERGPIANAILTYGQSSNPASPHATDQLKAYSRKEWHRLPFHAEDVAKARIGEPLQLKR